MLLLKMSRRAERGKTTIITAHRLSAVVHADMILVLENGRITERGRHQELLEKKGWYFNTYRMQQLEMEEYDAIRKHHKMSFGGYCPMSNLIYF